MIKKVREYINFMLNEWQQRSYPSIEKRYSVKTYQVYPVGRKIEDLFLIQGKQAPFLIRSMLNKSILRLAIEEFVQNKPDVFLFSKY